MPGVQVTSKWQSFQSNRLRISYSEFLGIISMGSGWSLDPSRPIGLDYFSSEGSQGVFLSRGCSSAGRAPDLHSGGRRFDPDQLHQFCNGGYITRRQYGLMSPILRR